MNEILSGLLDLVQSVDPVLRTALAGIGMMLETSVLIGLLVPGDTVVIVASTAVASPAEFFWMVGVIVTGALLGESFGFWLGRTFGGAIRRSWVGRRIGEKNWERAENYLDHRGGIAVFLSRFLPVLHSLIPLTVGMSRMSYRRFLTWTIPACIIWAFAYVGVGAGAAGAYRELADRLHWAGFIFVGIILAFLVVVFLFKKLLSRREARHLAAVDPSLPAEPTAREVVEAVSEEVLLTDDSPRER